MKPHSRHPLFQFHLHLRNHQLLDFRGTRRHRIGPPLGWYPFALKERLDYRPLDRPEANHRFFLCHGLRNVADESNLVLSM